ncbi:Response regulator PleD [compost metagenome]
MLRSFSRLLEDCLRHCDIICRWGGEEFIVLLKNTDSQHARMIAEKIRLQTEHEAFTYADQDIRLTTSVGFTALQAGDTLHTLLARADKALYRAKQSGRNCVCSELPRTEYA